MRNEREEVETRELREQIVKILILLIKNTVADSKSSPPLLFGVAADEERLGERCGQERGTTEGEKMREVWMFSVGGGTASSKIAPARLKKMNA
ncbi:hypothetical protein A2U01_0020925, partial [Trifolium medium]|nr:hypothetical protein [Trifolium medium]